MSDKILLLGDGSSSQRFKDMGDGTVARVVAAGVATGSGADKLIDLGDGTKIRLKNMGDGTFSKVFYGT